MTPETWLKAAKKRAAKFSFEVGPEGVTGPRGLITATPLTIDAAFQGEIRWLRLSWLQNGRIRRTLFPKGALTSKQRLSDLGVLGIDVGRHNFRRIESYLQQVEAKTTLREYPIQSGMGWNEDRDAFVLGGWCIREGAIVSADPTLTDPDPAAIHLAPNSLPYQIVTEEDGTWEAWVETANLAGGKHPRLGLAIYAALVPPLQRILGLPSFAVQWVGPPSTGKSTAVCLGASVWGDPDPLSDRSMIQLWSTPTPQLEMAAAVLRDLPMCLDDLRTRVQLSPFKMESILSGQSVGACRQRWNTVVLSSGPDGLEEAQGHEALGGRSLTLWGPPLGKQDKSTAADIAAIREGITGNFGHLGPLFIQRLMKERAQWPKWGVAYNQLASKLAGETAGQGGMAGACASYVAAIGIAAEAVHALVPELTFESKPTMQDLWSWLRTNGARTAKATLALQHVMDYVARFPSRFIKIRRIPDDKVPKGGWAGLMDDSGRVWVVVGLVNDLLASGSFDSDIVYREWIQQGVIQSHHGKVWKTVMLGSRSARCVGFLPQADEP